MGNCFRGYDVVVQTLLEHNADPLIENEQGDCVLDHMHINSLSTETEGMVVCSSLMRHIRNNNKQQVMSLLDKSSSKLDHCHPQTIGEVIQRL